MTSSERYTLGYSETAVGFVGRRTLESHGAFFVPYVRADMDVLDCGCGPGSMTFGIAARTARGTVVGIDMDPSQIDVAKRIAAECRAPNVEFRQASVYRLPFEARCFDAVFSHALFEHISDPVTAAKECFRVLKPGGIVALATPDWGGFIVEPMTPALASAIAAYEAHLAANGGDARVGRRLGEIVTLAGFVDVRMHARYENYEPLTIIGEVMACQAEGAGAPQHAETFRRWQRTSGGLWAQAWVSCVARRPG